MDYRKEKKENQIRRCTMLLQVKGKNMLVLPKNICQELGIFKGDQLHASVEGGKIILRPAAQFSRNKAAEDSRDLRKDGRKSRILMFGSVVEAFDESDFD
jgi:antitoxin component of MazEF toxin-antitoxin module